MAKHTPLIHAGTTTSKQSPAESAIRRVRTERQNDLLKLLKQHHRRMQEGPVVAMEGHPIVGRTYQRLNSDALYEFLADARIMDTDARFISFSLVYGTHGRKKTPFLCVKNCLEDGLHLLIGGKE